MFRTVAVCVHDTEHIWPHDRSHCNNKIMVDIGKLTNNLLFALQCSKICKIMLTIPWNHFSQKKTSKKSSKCANKFTFPPSILEHWLLLLCLIRKSFHLQVWPKHYIEFLMKNLRMPPVHRLDWEEKHPKKIKQWCMWIWQFRFYCLRPKVILILKLTLTHTFKLYSQNNLNF